MSAAQHPARADDLPLSRWRPQARTVAPATDVDQPAVPCVDAHDHVDRWLSPDGGWLADPEEVLATLDAAGVEVLVNLDGRWGEELTADLDRYDRAHPGRFATSCHLDRRALQGDDPTAALLAQLDDAVARGTRGLQGWKDLGLTRRDAAGALVRPDDPRVVPVLEAAGEHGLPVLVHTADPLALLDPLDAEDERLDELAADPERWFGAPGLPSADDLLEALLRLVAATPGTTCAGAHALCAEDLGWVGDALDRHPNQADDVGGRMAELGRTPRGFAALVRRHPGRVLFGSDAFPPTAAAYRTWYRFPETADEALDDEPGSAVPPQGRWRVSGAAQPPELCAGDARRQLHLG